MPISKDHYALVRNHFYLLLGNECVLCGGNFDLELHHKQACNTLSGEGRGRERRMWNWFEEFEKKNLSLICRKCHNDFHKTNGDSEQ